MLLKPANHAYLSEENTEMILVRCLPYCIYMYSYGQIIYDYISEMLLFVYISTTN